ncbi:hypothetical protein FTUN_0713 [Frigoriglobus tundricola]|uniref:Uncharacterized protein n=1 Tax=Frigoriglobus tundricola TaxID=2774151 RepID=A0A6M5YGU1_9BACT|nr:hypothetical protein FTUN_0713 [Frigoriglobus tundricola]
MGSRGRAEDSKKASEEQAQLVLIDDTCLFLNLLVRRSWARRGRPAVIGGGGEHRNKVSVIGAVSVSPRTRRLGFSFYTRADGFFGAAEVVGSCGTCSGRWWGR